MNKGILAIVAVVLIGGAFYGGMVYGKQSASAASNTAGNRRNFQGANFGNGGRGNGGAIGGTILQKTNNTLTVTLPNNGGTRLIIFSTSTPIRKQAQGTLEDLQIGTGVLINGTSNSDGSLTAEAIQLRSPSSTDFFGPGVNNRLQRNSQQGSQSQDSGGNRGLAPGGPAPF